VWSPMKVKTRTGAGVDVSMEYSPLLSVTAPLDVPFSTTLTPGSDEPSSSVTVPETVIWPRASIENSMKQRPAATDKILFISVEFSHTTNEKKRRTRREGTSEKLFCWLLF